MKRSPYAAAFLMAVLMTSCGEPDYGLVKVGDPAPDFSVPTLDGRPFQLSATQGRVRVINFFATWCPSCQEEMPHLEKEVWQRFKDRPGFDLLVVAREQTPEELLEFRKAGSITLPMAVDPKREAFDRYATKGIPRTYLIGRDGRILDQLLGFEPEAFKAMVKRLEEALNSASPSPSTKP